MVPRPPARALTGHKPASGDPKGPSRISSLTVDGVARDTADLCDAPRTWSWAAELPILSQDGTQHARMARSPACSRGGQCSWRAHLAAPFGHRYADRLLAVDFSGVETVWLQRLDVLFSLWEIGSPCIHLGSCTASPHPAHASFSKVEWSCQLKGRTSGSRTCSPWLANCASTTMGRCEVDHALAPHTWTGGAGFT